MKIKMLFAASLLSLAIFQSCTTAEAEPKAYNQGINIIPAPVSLTTQEGEFKLDSKSKIVYTKGDEKLAKIADLFAAKMSKSTGYNISTTDAGAKSNVVELSIDSTMTGGEESYTLNVTPEKVIAVGKSAHGVFNAMQSFMQLLPAEIESAEVVKGIKWTAPAVSIKDEPTFKYRGMHLDVTRHFRDVDFVKKQLDVLAMFKINTLHWHLTDDQLWTVEIKKYPKLTEIGSKRLEGDGTYEEGFYTQEQMKDVVAYAAERYIDVIPEIELPGHGLAALTAYPEYSCTGGPFNIRNVWGVEPDVFCAGNDSTFLFLQDIISEVVPIFPSKYFHIGGDECPKDRWKVCPKCQKRMKELGLKNEMELQSYFVQRIEKHVNSLGKQVIGWDEILEGGIAPSATIMSWRGEAGGIEAANAGHDVVMTPNGSAYIDYYQGAPEAEPIAIGGYVPLQKVYEINPIPAAIKPENAHHVIGAQANLWSEYLYSPEQVEYMAYPRIIAMAEATWSPSDKKNFEDFSRRINNAYVRLDGHNINYHIPLPEGPVSNYIAMLDSTKLGFSNTRNYPMVYTVDGTEPTAKSNTYKDSLTFSSDVTVKIATLLPSGKLSTIRTIEVKKEALAPAYTGETKPGILVKRLEGYHRNSEAYKNAKFSEAVVEKDFSKFPENAYKTPTVEISEGYFEVPGDGIYTLSTDQEQLFIDGRLVINNDNKVVKGNAVKTTAALAKGKHKFTLYTNNSLYGGWPKTWAVNNFVIKAPLATEFVAPEKLSY